MIKYWEVNVSYSWDRLVNTHTYNFENEKEANEFYKEQIKNKKDGKSVSEPKEKNIIFKKELLDVKCKEYKKENNQWVFRDYVDFDLFETEINKEEIIKKWSEQIERYGQFGLYRNLKFVLTINDKIEKSIIFEDK